MRRHRQRSHADPAGLRPDRFRFRRQLGRRRGNPARAPAGPGRRCTRRPAAPSEGHGGCRPLEGRPGRPARLLPPAPGRRARRGVRPVGRNRLLQPSSWIGATGRGRGVRRGCCQQRHLDGCRALPDRPRTGRRTAGGDLWLRLGLRAECSVIPGQRSTASAPSPPALGRDRATAAAVVRRPGRRPGAAGRPAPARDGGRPAAGRAVGGSHQCAAGGVRTSAAAYVRLGIRHAARGHRIGGVPRASARAAARAQPASAAAGVRADGPPRGCRPAVGRHLLAPRSRRRGWSAMDSPPRPAP